MAECRPMIWLTILGCILLVLLILCAVVFAIAVKVKSFGEPRGIDG